MAASARGKQRGKGESKVVGVVRWDDSSGAVPDVEIDLYAVEEGSLKIVATGKADRSGEFALKLNDEATRDNGHSLQLPRFVVRSNGQLLTTTPILAAALEEGAGVWKTSISVPASRRSLLDPKRRDRPKVRVGLIDVDAERLAKMTQDDLLTIARLIVNGDVAERDVARVEALAPELNARRLGQQTLCLTPVLRAIDEIVRLKEWPRELLHETDRIIRRFDAGFAAATYDCGNFSVTYQTSGPATVDPSTAALDILDPGTATVLDTISAGGSVPTYVRLICWWANRALNAYINAPFSLKNPAAGGKIPINVTDTQFGGANPSGFTIGNALNPEIVAAVTVHELFHMVQFEYGAATATGEWTGTLTEGGAVFAEDTAADAMNRYLFEASSSEWSGVGVMPNPNGSIKWAAYDAALFFRYIAEQQSPDVYEPFVGVETYRKLIEQCEADGYITSAVTTAIRDLPWYQDFYEFHYLDPARLDRTSSETLFGNYALACYLKGVGVNEPDQRFDFIEDSENITFDEVLNPVLGSPLTTFATLAPVDIAGPGTVTTGGPIAFSGSVNSFAHQNYEVVVDAAVTNVDVQFTASPGLTSVIFQIALIDEDGHVRDIHRTDATSYTKRITNVRDGKHLSKLALIVSGADSGGAFSLTATAAPPTPDVMVTRWHSAMKNEYEINPYLWAWTWVSPDIWVDNNNDGLADGEVFFDYNNKLRIRLHNKGNAAASGIQVEFWYQDASGALPPGSWLPVQNKGGATQVLTGLSLAAGVSKDWHVNWSPSPSGTSKHFCVKAVVTVPGDANTDNKRVLSNFGNVIVKPGGWADIEFLRRNLDEEVADVELLVIPRLPYGLELSARDLAEQRVKRLRQSERVIDRIRLTHLGTIVKREPDREPRTQGSGECAVPIVERVPDARGHFATDPRALPPGMAEMPLVTVAHRQGGLLTGGVTFMVTEEGAEGPD